VRHSRGLGGGGLTLCSDRLAVELFTHPTSELLLRLLVDVCAAALRMQKGHTTVESVLDVRSPHALFRLR
jgi:hypothetical protein